MKQDFWQIIYHAYGDALRIDDFIISTSGIIYMSAAYARGLESEKRGIAILHEAKSTLKHFPLFSDNMRYIKKILDLSLTDLLKMEPEEFHKKIRPIFLSEAEKIERTYNRNVEICLKG